MVMRAYTSKAMASSRSDSLRPAHSPSLRLTMSHLPTTPTPPNLPQYDDGDCTEDSFDDDSILQVLTQAGLHHEWPKELENTGHRMRELTDERRRRWVMGEVLNDCVEAVVEEYGYQDERGVGLGIMADDMYEWLGGRNVANT